VTISGQLDSHFRELSTPLFIDGILKREKRTDGEYISAKIRSDADIYEHWQMIMYGISFAFIVGGLVF
jgi:hypothetical protein